MFGKILRRLRWIPFEAQSRPPRLVRRRTLAVSSAASACEPAARSTAQLGSDKHALPGTRPPSVNDLIGALQERWRDRQPDRLRGSEIYGQLELRGLLHGQVAGLGSLEDL